MLPRLLLLTDRSQLPLGRSLLATLRECVAAGATTVVVRELDLPDTQRAALVEATAALGAAVISAHHRLPGAVAVHLPSGAPVDAPVNAPLEPPVEPSHGRSCHSADDVRRAAAEGAAYATLSPYAVSSSKPGHGPPLQNEQFADHAIPVYALGGITPCNAGAAIAAGAHGVAVMGAVMRSADPAVTVAALLDRVGR